MAQAEAEKIRKIGEAEAAVIEAMGKAEAERMKLKAEAYQKYGDAAKMALVLEALPQVRSLPTPACTQLQSPCLTNGKCQDLGPVDNLHTQLQGVMKTLSK